MIKQRNIVLSVAKTKAQLICTFVLTYAKGKFSHDVAHVLHV